MEVSLTHAHCGDGIPPGTHSPDVTYTLLVHPSAPPPALQDMSPVLGKEQGTLLVPALLTKPPAHHRARPFTHALPPHAPGAAGIPCLTPKPSTM